MVATDRAWADDSPEADQITPGQLWLAVKRRWLPAVLVLAATVGLTAAWKLQQPSKFKAQGQLAYRGASQSPVLRLPGDASSDADSSATSELAMAVRVLQSKPVAREVIKRLELTDRNGDPLAPAAVLAPLDVSQLEDANIIELSYQSQDPKRASRIINAFMEVYQARKLRTKRAEARSARQFVQRQLPQARERVSQLERRLTQFQQRNGLTSLEQASKALTETGEELERQISQARVELQATRTQLADLRDTLGMGSQQAFVAGKLSQLAGVQQVLEQYQQVEAQLASKQSELTPQHPAVQDLQQKRDNLQGLLQQRVRQALRQRSAASDRSQLSELEQGLVGDLLAAKTESLVQQSRLQALQRARESQQERAERLPQLAAQQRRLERELQLATQDYKSLKDQLQQARLEENKQISEVSILEQASVSPVSANMGLTLAVAGMLGSLLGGGTALLLDMRDREVKTVRDVRQRLAYPLLGSIPTWSATDLGAFNGKVPATSLPVRDAPDAPVSESFRMLQANLRFSQSDRKLSTLAVTSSANGEGKSAVVANLALALAEVGNRVAIVDADMRRPSQHHFWEYANATGLSNILVGEAELAQAVQSPSQNLDVLTAGTVPPNPVALLDSQNMAACLRDCSQRYDYVLIDTPPFNQIADASVVGRLSSGTLLIVRPGVAEFAGLNFLQEGLLQSQQSVVGLIVNGIIPANEPDSYYHYYAKNYYRYGQRSGDRDAQPASLQPGRSRWWGRLRRRLTPWR